MMKKYRTIDLFSGIGGIRKGFEKTGRIENVFSSEIDKYACNTYFANFKEDSFYDITQVKESEIPDFDILLGGFPCQAFSIAGKKAGFDDTRGTLFFDVARIIKAKKPQAFLLENVKGLTIHKGGETFRTIISVLTNELGYKVYWKVLNSRDYGVPQNRERIYIVGFRGECNDFEFPEKTHEEVFIRSILDKSPVSPKYYLSQRYLNTLVEHKKRHEKKGNGFGFQVHSWDSVSNAIVVGGMGRERNLIVDERVKEHTDYGKYPKDINSSFIRTLTPREWARLQGYDDDYVFPVSDVQAYKQLGNSVTVNVINAIAKKVIPCLDSMNRKSNFVKSSVKSSKKVITIKRAKAA